LIVKRGDLEGLWAASASFEIPAQRAVMLESANALLVEGKRLPEIAVLLPPALHAEGRDSEVVPRPSLRTEIGARAGGLVPVLRASRSSPLRNHAAPRLNAMTADSGAFTEAGLELDRGVVLAPLVAPVPFATSRPGDSARAPAPRDIARRSAAAPATIAAAARNASSERRLHHSSASPLPTTVSATRRRSATPRNIWKFLLVELDRLRFESRASPLRR